MYVGVKFYIVILGEVKKAKLINFDQLLIINHLFIYNHIMKLFGVQVNVAVWWWLIMWSPADDIISNTCLSLSPSAVRLWRAADRESCAVIGREDVGGVQTTDEQSNGH